MEFKKLFFQCECGRSPSRIRELGLSTDHELLIRWWCPGCKRHVFVVKGLAHFWDACPTLQGQAEALAEDVTTYDAQFLRSLGIRFPEGVRS